MPWGTPCHKDAINIQLRGEHGFKQVKLVISCLPFHKISAYKFKKKRNVCVYRDWFKNENFENNPSFCFCKQKIYI